MSRDEEIAKLLAKHADRLRHLESLEHGIEPFTAHPNNPAARAYHDANQNIGSGVWTPLNLNQERFDTDSIHDLVINNERLTCQTSGIYVIIGQVRWASSAVGRREITISVNAAIAIAVNRRQAVAGVQEMVISTIYELGVGDFVYLDTYQDSGGGLNVLSAANHSPEFMMARIG